MLCSQDAINGYKLMWLYVMFDLPVETKVQRKRTAQFRKNLLKDGFGMHQFSVYIRHCASYSAADVHIERVRRIVPDEGSVSILKVTDKQFESTIHLVGKKAKLPPPTPLQLELF